MWVTYPEIKRPGLVIVINEKQCLSNTPGYLIEKRMYTSGACADWETEDDDWERNRSDKNRRKEVWKKQ
jgi:hypothetical protein